MPKPKFNRNDFDFSFHTNEGTAVVTHFELAEEHRGKGHASFIIETIKRIALHKDGIDTLKISMGGGEDAEEFLKTNGFKIQRRRQYDNPEYFEGNYGVDAVYRHEWVGEDY